MAVEDSQSPSEVQVESQPEGGLPPRLLGAKTQPQAQLASLTSEIALPRSYFSSPFMETSVSFQTIQTMPCSKPLPC